MSTGLAIGLALLFLAGNAFFVGAEFALVSARQTQLEPRAAGGSGRARLALRGMKNVSLMMAGAQLGITVCSLGLGAVGEPALAHLLEVPFKAVGLPEGAVHAAALAVALLVVVSLHMVLGEMVPKNLALAEPERAAVLLGPLLYGVVMVLRPLTAGLNWTANGVLRLLRVQPRDEVATAFTAEEVAGFVAESRRAGELDDEEQQLLTQALEFVDADARSVALPLADLTMITPATTVAQLEELCVRTGFSRFPVAAGAEDERGGLRQGPPGSTEPGRAVAGYVHLKDLLATPADRRDEPLPPECIHELVRVEATDSLRDVLHVMQPAGAHLARVVDDDSVIGLAALEDVLEKLVGEVTDATQRAARRG